MGEVHAGYEPIIYRNEKFHVSNPSYTSSPVLRVTGYGASAFADRGKIVEIAVELNKICLPSEFGQLDRL